MKVNRIYLFFFIFFLNLSFANAANFLATVAIKSGIGEISAKSIESRNHQTYGAEIDLGIIHDNYIFALSLDLIQWNQNSDIKDDTNFSGIAQSLSIPIGLATQNFAFIVKPVIYSEFKRSFENSNGDIDTYSSPQIPSYSLQILYNIPFGGHIGLEYNSITYSKTNKVELDSSHKISLNSTYLVLGINF